MSSCGAGSARTTSTRGCGKDGPTTTEREELRLLRAEVKTLRMERDFLKKAAAFFAKEIDRTR